MITIKAVGNTFSEQIKQKIKESAAIPKVRLVASELLYWWPFIEYGTAEFSVTRGGKTHTNPGIKPRAFIRKVLPEVQERISLLVHDALSRGVSTADMIETLKAAMEDAKQKFTESLALEAPGHRPSGRLKGKTAAEVFNSETSVVTSDDK